MLFLNREKRCRRVIPRRQLETLRIERLESRRLLAAAVLDDPPSNSDFPPLSVASFDQTSSGFTIEFDGQLDPEALNLFGSMGSSDVTFDGEQTGPVAGSFVLGPALRSAAFIKTGSPLSPDQYSVHLKSGSSAFKSTDGSPLDGDGDGIAGGDFLASFEVLPPPPQTISVGIPDFVRGPGQVVNVPATSAMGIPLSLSDTAGVRSISLQIEYDPTLLAIDSVAASAGMPEGSITHVIEDLPGRLKLMFESPTELPLGPVAFATLQAHVPAANGNENYGRKQVIDVSDVVIHNDAGTPLSSLDNDALHVTSYPGDVTGNGKINASDVATVSRVVRHVDGGFDASRLADPATVGDIDGDGIVSESDLGLIAQAAASAVVAEIPPIPVGVVTFPSIAGPDPRLSIPKNITAVPGQTVVVPVELDSIVTLAAPNRLIGSDLVILFDNTVLTATAVSAGDFISTRPAWAFVESIENTLGVVTVVAFTSAPLAGSFAGTLVNLHFTVNADAQGGTTPINLVESFANKITDLVDEGDQFLTLEGPVTNASNDPIDGLITISGASSVWQNPVNRLDVDENGAVSSIDVLSVINELNLRRILDANGRLPATRNAGQFFYDVTGEGFLSPTDVLTIINFLNSGAEGEGSGASGTLDTGVTIDLGPEPADAVYVEAEERQSAHPASLPTDVVADWHRDGTDIVSHGLEREFQLLAADDVDQLLGG